MKKGLREKFFWLAGVYVWMVYGCKSVELVVVQWDINYGRYWFSNLSSRCGKKMIISACIQLKFRDENYPCEK